MKHKVEVHWEITNNCNLRCKHCLVSAGDSLINDVKLTDILNFLDLLKSQEEVLISFTGGEPFFRKDFDKILLKCIQNNFKIQIITNGLLLNKNYLEIIKRNKIHLGISIESFNKEHFEVIRGPGTFDRLMKNLKKLEISNIPFDIYSTINKFNIDDIEQILLMAKHYGSHVHFNDLTISGRAKNYNEILIDNSKNLDKIVQASNKVYGISKMDSDENCWATNDVLFINSFGDIYCCTELARCCSKLRIGSIFTFPIDKYYEKCPTINYYFSAFQCPYKVYFNDQITYVSDLKSTCPWVSNNRTIDSLEELYNEFDSLFSGITEYCHVCNYKDCMGFIWLLNSEKDRFDKENISTITINNNVDFLYFLKEYSNVELKNLNFLEIKYPRCEHYCEQNKNCLIHKIRPLACHMYPIGIETAENGTLLWVLHDECQFVQELIKNDKLQTFVFQALSIINRINSTLYLDIVLKYKQVDDLSLFLNGINSYIILKEVDANVKV